MTWWLWILVGLGLLALELFTPSGFFIFFIGVSFLITGTVTYFEILSGLTQQLVLTSFLTLLLVLLLRKRISGLWASAQGTTGDSRSIEGQMVVLSETIKPGASGRGSFRGANWTVKNIGSITAESGKEYVVVSRQGISVSIEAK